MSPAFHDVHYRDQSRKRRPVLRRPVSKGHSLAEARPASILDILCGKIFINIGLSMDLYT